MESFKTRLNKTSYTISFVNADTFYSRPKAPKHLHDTIQSLVWERLVAPKGPNFRGKKVRK